MKNLHLIAIAMLQTSASLSATSIDDTMLITANRTEQALAQTLSSAVVFDRSDITSLNASSIADVLTRIAGVTTQQSGTSAHEMSIYSRGASTKHILVLVNGVKVGSSTIGYKNISTIPIDTVERIEFVKGPRASVWGSDAIGGVLHIFTRSIASGETELSLNFGTNSMFGASIAHGLGDENHSYTINTVSETSSGYDVHDPDPANPYDVDQPDADGYSVSSVGLVGASVFDDRTTVNVSAQLDQGTVEYDAQYSGDEYTYENYLLHINAVRVFSKSQLMISAFSAEDYNIDNALVTIGTQSNKYSTTRNGMSILYSRNFDFANTSIGVDYVAESVDASVNYSATDRDLYAMFATANKTIDDVKYEVSLRNDIVDGSAKLTYNAGIGYRVSPATLVSVLTGTAFKSPTFNDMYWPDMYGSSGNPYLQPEQSNSNEVMVRYNNGNLSLDVSAYMSEYTNLIEWRPSEPVTWMSTWAPVNVASATSTGFDISATVSTGSVVHSVSYGYVDISDNSSNKQLVMRPYDSASYSATANLATLELSATAVYTGSRESTDGSILDASTVINLGITSYATSDMSIKVVVNNITGEQYEYMSCRPNPGTTYTIGVQYRF